MARKIFNPVPFAMQTGDAGVTQNSRERLINMFAEIPASGRSQIIRRQRACLDSDYTIAGEKRCIEKHGDTHYLIIDANLCSWDGTTLTTLATLSTATGRCSMIFNASNEIMISDGTNLVWWNGTILQSVTNPAAFTPGNLAYLGGFGIIQEAGSGRFYITPAEDFSQIDALDFATAEGNPDNLQTVFSDHNELWLPGKESIEIWQNVGGSDFPFQAATNAKIERGTAAGLSLAAEDNSVVFLGEDLILYKTEDYRPVRISNYAVEELLRNCTAAGIAAAYAFIYTLAGNKFYTLTVPDELTIQYNFATGLCNEANTYGFDAWNVIGSAGHKSNYVLTPSGICTLSPDINEDEGNTVLRKAISAPGWADGRRITMTEFFADCEVGRAALGVEAEIMLRVARDGETFGNIRTVSLGETGNYQTRPVWRGLGQGTKPVLELSASGDFRFVIMDTLLNASVSS
jgi:hypothetical protein